MFAHDKTLKFSGFSNYGGEVGGRFWGELEKSRIIGKIGAKCEPDDKTG